MTTSPVSSSSGTEYITGSRTSSTIDRSPRAPVSRAIALSAMARRALSSKVRVTPSISNSRWYWRTSEFFGSVRIRTRASESRWPTWVMTGSRPISSGMRPKRTRSSDSTNLNGSGSSSDFAWISEPKPTPVRPRRSLMTFSRPAKAPETMNSTFFVSNWMNSWFGCFRPPCGGTEATVPSRIFSSACCTPSPETSRVIDGFSDLREILSTSST
jgi:hypothetical protein